MSHDEGNGTAAYCRLRCLRWSRARLREIVGAVFRLSLEEADRLRAARIGWAHGRDVVGFILVVAVCTGATALAAWVVRCCSPHAAGSGIPHVEAVLRGELSRAPFYLIPLKFFGELLAIGAGLALGREGPSVQMGASLAPLVGKVFRRGWADCLDWKPRDG